MHKNINLVIQRKLKSFRTILSLLIKVSNWYDIFLVVIRIKRYPVLKLTNGIRFKIGHYLDTGNIKDIFIDDEYSKYQELEKPDVIIDIGANIGTFSILQAIKYPNSIVYSYEPADSTYLLLEENLKLNRIKNVVAIKKAIAGRKGYKDLYIYDASSLSSLFDTRTNARKEKVETVTLSDVFTGNKITRCDLLKIDCEGAEYDILLKTPKELFTKINNIVLEYHDGLTKNNHKALLRILKSRGYIVQFQKNKVEDDVGIIYAKKDAIPLVSVVIPVFKRFGFAKQAIRSVLNQENINLEEIELIICDDEKDRSNQDFYKRIYPKIVYLKNRFEEGPGGNRQTGLKHARGKYIVFLDSDDRLKTDFLAKMVNVLKYNDSAISVVCL